MQEASGQYLITGSRVWKPRSKQTKQTNVFASNTTTNCTLLTRHHSTWIPLCRPYGNSNPTEVHLYYTLCMDRVINIIFIWASSGNHAQNKQFSLYMSYMEGCTKSTTFDYCHYIYRNFKVATFAVSTDIWNLDLLHRKQTPFTKGSCIINCMKYL